jgi:hypothetical protein
VLGCRIRDDNLGIAFFGKVLDLPIQLTSRQFTRI